MGLALLAMFTLLAAACLETEARPVAKQPPGQAVQIDGPPGLTKGGPLEKVGPDLARLLQQRILQLGAGEGKPFGTYVAPEVAQALSDPIHPSGLPIPVKGGTVAIDAVASGDPAQLLADLEALGLQGGASSGAVVSGRLPVAAIDKVASLNSLRFARPAYAMTHVGLTTSQGDIAMGTGAARGIFTVDGSGVTVGVLSDSFDCLGGAADDVLVTGDLPGGINLLQDEVGCVSGTDEGRAMMQLIRDVATGASQSFHTAFGGTAVFANGIRALAAAGADVIADDVIYLAEPMFQDGIIA